MLTLQCRIKIKSKATNKTVTFDYVNSIEVKTSCKNLTDTATVKVPKKMSWKGRPLSDYVKRNDEISIEMGYKEYGLETVFNGYVNTVENGLPLVITCENDMRLFKMTDVDAEVIPNFDLKAFLKRYVPGLKVECPDNLDFGTVTIEKGTLANFLDKLKSSFGWFDGYFQDGVFYTIFNKSSYTKNNIVTFDPERNQISDNLKYTLAEDVRIAVKVIHINKDNTKLEVTLPKDTSGCEMRQFFCPEFDTKEKLQEEAERKLSTFKCDRMDGTITAFGVPFVRKGDVVLLKDEEREERNGKKFCITSVDYKFDTNGYRQTITLGDQIH